jgi:hypothetical protein
MDISLLTGFGGETKFVDSLLKTLKPRLQDMRSFALKNRIILLWSHGNIPIDIALAGLPFEETMIASSSHFEFADGISLRTCSADDLVVMKAFADRDRDWADVKGIVTRQKSLIKWDYILQQLEPLCIAKENPGILEKLRSLKNQV